jgi:hypothetical protein
MTALVLSLLSPMPSGSGADGRGTANTPLDAPAISAAERPAHPQDSRSEPRACFPDPRPAAPASHGTAPPLKATIAQVAWLSGTWTGTTGGATIEERWTPAARGSMLAVARTLKNGVMVAFEFLCIVEREGGVVYSAMPNGRTPATDFGLTAVDAASATFENPAHDFPKKIRYALRPDGSLEATISGERGQGAQTFVFKRQD